MKLQRLHLKDFQSYDDEEVLFDEGISIIYGENGAGKSTLLRGIFAALFQTSMKSELTGDINIGGLVNKNESSGSVELEFTENGQEYTVFWEIDVTEDDDGERRGRTKKCTLSSSDGSVNLSSVTEVSEYMADLLGLDAQAFVNSVYVQQEELTKLLTADTDTRKEIFDRLLGLQEIDKYIERVDKARREVKSVRKEKTNRKEELQGQLDEKPSLDELESKQSRLNKEIKTLDDEISKLRTRKEDLTAKQTKLENADESAEELEERKEALDEEIDNKQSEIGDLNAEISQLKKKKENLQQKLENTPDGDIDSLKSQLSDYRTQRDSVKEQAMELQSEVNSLQEDLRMALETLNSIESDIQNQQKQKAEQSQQLGTIRGELNSKINQRDEIRDALADEGFTATDSIQAVQTAQSQITTQKTDAENALEQKRSTLEDVRSQIATKTERQRNIEERIETLQSDLELPKAFEETGVNEQKLEDIETELIEETDVDELTEETVFELLVNILPDEQRTVRESIEEYDDIEEKRLSALYYTQLAEQKETQETIDSLKEEVESLEEDIQSLIDKRERLSRQVDYLQSTVEERTKLKQQANQLEATLEEITELQSEEETVAKQVDEIDEEIESLEEKREEADAELVQVESNLKSTQEELQDAQDELDETEALIEEVESDLEDLRDAQQTRNQLEQVETKITNKRDRVSDKAERRADAQEELDTVTEKLNDIDETDMSVEEIEAEIEDVEQSLQKKENTKDSKNAELVSVKNTIEDIESLQERVRKFDSDIQDLTKKLEQVKSIKQSYISVKESTRKQYLSKINQYTNEIFTAIYENKSYESVRIDSDYRITLRTSEGTEIEPALTSGGESAIVNLALRAGVYRVITEAGNTSLPPFILDEPTTFLDTQHVGKLEALARKMADWDIKQVFIVSHNEQLIESGDAVYHVSKETNSSKVEKEY